MKLVCIVLYLHLIVKYCSSARYFQSYNLRDLHILVTLAAGSNSIILLSQITIHVDTGLCFNLFNNKILKLLKGTAKQIEYKKMSITDLNS